MTDPSFHFLVTPPYCSAKMRETAHPMLMMAPPQSSLSTWPNISFEYPLYVAFRPSGGLVGWNKSRHPSATPPSGRLM